MSDHPHYTDPDGDERSTHPLNVGYLVVGLVFLGIAGIWALSAAGVLDSGALGWLVPTVLMAAGSIGLVASVTRERTRLRRSTDPDTDELDQ